MNRIDRARCLQLDNDVVGEQEIRLIHADRYSPKEHGYGELTTEGHSRLRERDSQRVTVNCLEKSVPKLMIDIEEAVQKLLGDVGMAIGISIAGRTRICG